MTLNPDSDHIDIALAEKNRLVVELRRSLDRLQSMLDTEDSELIPADAELLAGLLEHPAVVGALSGAGKGE